ncbi:BTB/POZ-like [Penicillium digitatum]|uniref:BTB domain-containing protein n=3 Tax=Penicillium digitatum TaxID=36651 RepID=K9FCX9_PEND2|nr:hypothetical protein PDIP_30100 [Penicillium digitatum Pd1]EKV05977.1 hypothetical protein PDIG_81740 [Penicillium digitatum PHI26]EKV17745.1 hypothetical protein PDIP_30100 [Penicillium digitatum Pd1]KAG0155195.1 hypothetical protein PDIDSM_769 [Penicillium digitatum]QQK46896.1 BTB/POZ-like [Penicillium digitatum]
MVSQAQIVDCTTVQSTASLVSRPSSRRHRSSRSYHGSSSHLSSNDFPIFTYTGDTEIVIRAGSQERRYLLHRLILSQCSGFFEVSINEDWSRQTTLDPSKPDGTLSRLSEDDDLSNGSTLASSDNDAVLMRPGEKRRWRYELDWENRAEDEEAILVQKQPTYAPISTGDLAVFPSKMTKPSNAQAGFIRSMANLAGMQSAAHLPQTGEHAVAVDPLIRDYDNLLRIFYNHAPIVNGVNIASAYTECKSLLALADMYDALPVTGPRVDHHLLGFGSRLFKQIAKYPPSYLKLGYLARSKVIFSEALIHVVGQWPAALPSLRNGSYAPLPDSVIDLIEDKVEDLDELKARVESKLLRLTLTTSRGERVGPSNAYLDWLAVCLFRQWLIENTTPPPPPILKNSGPSDGPTQPTASASHPASTSRSTTSPDPCARIYRLIGSSSARAYLAYDDLKRFLKLHPTSSAGSLYTRETLKRFERKVDEMKRLARDIVKPLMRNFLELELKSPEQTIAATAGPRENAPAGLPYLTCTRVEEIDLPWNMA